MKNNLIQKRNNMNLNDKIVSKFNELFNISL